MSSEKMQLNDLFICVSYIYYIVLFFIIILISCLFFKCLNISLQIYLDCINKTKLYFSDISITVEYNSTVLTFSTAIPKAALDNPRGLLGNINNDTSDDFIAKNGTAYPEDSTERTLFKYGQTCK